MKIKSFYYTHEKSVFIFMNYTYGNVYDNMLKYNLNCYGSRARI